MIKCKLVIFYLTTLLLIFGCQKFELPKNTIIYELNSKKRQEATLEDFLNKKQKYIILTIELECGVCLVEFKWWANQLKTHKKLFPIIIINSDKYDLINNLMKTEFVQFPIIIDNDYNICKNNLITSSRIITVVDGHLNILYRGNISNSKEFEQMYSNII
jgi:hypothetical protein